MIVLYITIYEIADGRFDLINCNIELIVWQ
jgi:hypothetical protein